jgi:hypothetical protein
MNHPSSFTNTEDCRLLSSGATRTEWSARLWVLPIACWVRGWITGERPRSSTAFSAERKPSSSPPETQATASSLPDEPMTRVSSICREVRRLRLVPRARKSAGRRLLAPRTTSAHEADEDTSHSNLAIMSRPSDDPSRWPVRASLMLRIDLVTCSSASRAAPRIKHQAAAPPSDPRRGHSPGGTGVAASAPA